MLQAGFDCRISCTDQFGTTHTPRSLAKLWGHSKLEQMFRELEDLETLRLLSDSEDTVSD